MMTIIIVADSLDILMFFLDDKDIVLVEIFALEDELVIDSSFDGGRGG